MREVVNRIAQLRPRGSRAAYPEALAVNQALDLVVEILEDAAGSIDVQGVAAIAWRCIRECKDYEGPLVMCPAHQEEAKAFVGVCFSMWCRCEPGSRSGACSRCGKKVFGHHP